MSEYSDDAPNITNSTEIDELVSYTRRRVENPIVIGDVTIYYFNSHEPDIDSLEQAVNQKLENNVYQVPLQITSGNMFIQSILPNRVREAEILIYREDNQEFFGYRNFIRDIPIEGRKGIKQELAWDVGPQKT